MNPGLGRLLQVSLASLIVAAGSPPQANEVVARAGPVTLTVADLRALLGQFEPPARQQVVHDGPALRDLIVDQLLQQVLLQKAHDAHWDRRPDIAYRANLARDTVIEQSYLASLTQPDPAYPPEADIEAAYEANKTRFVKPREYHLAQIFIAVPAGAPAAANEAAQARLRAIRQTLAGPNADFAAAARKSARDAGSSDAGGDLGWLREDQLAPPIRDAVAGLPVHAISDPVRTAQGWHLLKLVETRASATAPLAEVKDSLVRTLRQQKANDNARAYLKQMQSTQPMAINEILLAHAITP